MQCALSGQYPANPVVSKSTGKVYEKSLITKYIQQNNKCPITGQDITLDDLVEIDLGASVAKPRPPTLTSLPSLLSVFQSEWDSTMLETYSLKQQYQQVRQELSRALYQNDSATRVIARLIKERDEAIQALKDIKSHLGSSQNEINTSKSNGESKEPESKGEETFDDQVIEKLVETNASLSKSRKKRKNPEGLQTSDNITKFSETDVIGSLHSSTEKGLTALSVNGSLVATGGNDSKVIVHNVTEGTILSELSGHSKVITSLTWDPINHNIFSSSADNSSILWKPNEDNTSWSLAHRFPSHRASVTSISLHPCREYCVTGSMDATWNFNSLTGSQSLTSATNPDGAGYTSGTFHPDGLLLGLGTTNSTIQIWDVKSRSKVANFEDHHQQVSSISFSENGFYLASTSQNNIVKLWDLRKLKCFQEIEIPNTDKVNHVSWDQSGSYLAIGGSVVQVYQVKKWENPLVTLEQSASRVAFSDLAQKLFTVSDTERNLKIFSVAESEEN